MNVYHFAAERFISQNEAAANLLDLGFLRGYGVFDYVQVYSGIPFCLEEHLLRLQSSATKIGLPMPMEIGEIEEICYRLIEKNASIPDAGVRFVVTGGVCGDDLLLPSQKSNIYLLYHPYTPHPETHYTNGMRAITTEMLRAIPSVKTLDYFPAIVGMRKAKEMGFDDAIYLNEKQELLEGTTSNLFFFKGDRLITSESEHVVEGVTRAVLLKLAADRFNIEFRSVRLDEVESCDEAFLCSSVKDAVPLVQIDEMKVGNGTPGPRSAELRGLFREYRKEYLEKFEHRMKKNEQECIKLH